MSSLLWLALACGDEEPSVDEVAPTSPAPVLTEKPPPHEARARLLARHADAWFDVEIAETSRTSPIPEWTPVPSDKWRKAGSRDGVDTWAMPHPYRSPLVEEPPLGVRLRRKSGATLQWSPSPTAGSWSSQGDVLLVHTAAGSGPPSVEVYDENAFGKARGLDLGASGVAPMDFMLRTLRLKSVRRHGVFLPAPSTATTKLTVPADATMALGMTLLYGINRLEAPSDGARCIIEVGVDGRWNKIADTRLKSGDWKRGTLDLSPWEGREIHLRMRTDPMDGAHKDYVFIDEPVVYSPQEDPKRVVLVLIDTLRADRVGFSGAERDTTPALDAWAEEARVFERARAVAPWTLPSVRSALTGASPERWDETKSLPEVLGESGFESIAVVSNAYLSRTFGMDRDFSTHLYDSSANAKEVLDQARKQLARVDDRDAFVLVHFMDTHLPYKDPPETKGMFVESTPPGAENLRERTDFEQVSEAERAALRTWITDRYDESLRYLDGQIGTFLQELPDDALVVVASDHGEEFWDHGGFEHGHTLYDELMNVVFAVRGPQVAPGRTDALVSLADLTPTVLDWLGLPHEQATMGVSLTDALQGKALDRGPVPLGYVLFGEDQWGYVDDGGKVLSGQEGLVRFDLDSDPGETRALDADATGFREDLARAWARPAVDAIRIATTKSVAARPRTLRVTSDAEITAAWAGLEGPDLSVVSPALEAGEVTVEAGPDQLFPQEIFVALSKPAPLTLWVDGRSLVVTPGEAPQRFLEDRITVDRTIVPAAEAGSMQPMDRSAEEELRALGYIGD